VEDKYTLDFYEARFNLAFRAFRISRVNSEFKRLNRTKALSDPDDPDRPFDDEVLERLSERERAVGDPEQLVFTKQIRAAIRDLPHDERDALVLCRFIRLKEESDNPCERTAATVCGVTGRTIRNRLKRALAKLSKIKEVV
jgi:DNA-directed RNA polymerase specialized sigma24 family protein